MGWPVRTIAVLAALSASVPIAAGATATAEPIAVVGSFNGPASAREAIFSPDGRIVALPDGGFRASTVTLWDAASGLPLRTLADRAFFTAVRFNPDGATLVSGHQDGTVRLWSVATGIVAAVLRPKPKRDRDPDPVASVWTDAAGKVAVVGDHGGAVTIWNLDSRKPRLVIQRPPLDKIGNFPHILAARLSADGARLIVLSRQVGDGIDAVAIYDARTGGEKNSFKLPAGHALTENGLIGDEEAVVLVFGAACPLGELMLFSIRDRKTVAGIHKPTNCDRPKEGEATEPAKILSGSDETRLMVTQDGDPELQVWNVPMRQLERAVRWPDSADVKSAIGVSPDLKAVATVGAERVDLRDLDSGRSIQQFRGIATGARNIVGKDAAEFLLQQSRPAGEGTSFRVELRKPAVLPPIILQMSPGGNLTIQDVATGPMLAVAAGDAAEIVLLSLASGQELRRFPVPGVTHIDRARLSPDGGTLLVLGEAAQGGDAGNIAVLLDATDGSVRRSFAKRGSDDSLTALAFAPDGAIFAVGRHDGSAEIWNTATAQLVKTLPVYKEDGDTRTLAFSPDGRMLVGGGMFDDSVFMWNLADGEVVRLFELDALTAGYRYATAVALSHDRKTVVAGLGQRAVSSGDVGAERGNIVMWDAGTGKRWFTLRGHRGAITALGFSPDDKMMVSGSLDGTIRYWDRATGTLLATAASGSDGHWLTLTEAGFYAGSEGSDEFVAIVRGRRAVSAARFRDQLRRPDLVEQLLKGDPDGRYRAAARSLNLGAVLRAAPP